MANMESNVVRPKKGLVVIPRMPYPLNSGGRIAIYDALSLLAKKYKLVIIIIDDKKSNKDYIKELSPFSNEIYFFSANKFRFYFNTVIGLLKGNPLQVSYFYFKRVQNIVDEFSLSCDFFYAFMIRTSTYGLNLKIPKGHYAIDSMYLNYKKSQEKTTSVIWKLIYKIEVPLLYKAEREQIKKFDLTTFVNKDEAAYWQNHGNVATLPHGVEGSILRYNKFDDKYKNVVAFIGRMDYQPNIEAVIWFCNNVVCFLHKEIEFWIIGGYPTTEIQKLEKRYNNVKVLGFVEDPYVILRSCICTVAPMQTGGGLQTKILIAMAVESLVISTYLSANAIENAKNGVNIVIDDDPKNYVEFINDAYINPLKYLSVKQEAKNMILKTYSLEVIEKKLLHLIDTYLIIK